MNAKGPVFKYGDNIDTDVIIPARYLNTQSEAELASHCMEDIDKTFVTRVKAGDIMVGARTSAAAPPVSTRPSPSSIRHQLRHRQELCPPLLPQCHQHRSADSGVPRRQ